MVFGYNTNVAIGPDTVHVQTEDRGASHAKIDTTVHWKGRVLHRRTNEYKDLLPLDAGKETALKARVDEQHRVVVEEIRSGILKLTIPAASGPPPAAAKRAVPAQLKVELTNARSWLSGRNATLQLLVSDAAGNPVPSASATARVEGAASPTVFSVRTGDTGTAMLQFEMPHLSGDRAALIIEASHNGASGQLRFQLRARTKA